MRTPAGRCSEVAAHDAAPEIGSAAAAITRVTRAPASEVELAGPRPAAPPADLDRTCGLDVVEATHLGRPVVSAEPTAQSRHPPMLAECQAAGPRTADRQIPAV